MSTIKALHILGMADIGDVIALESMKNRAVRESRLSVIYTFA